MLSAPMLSIVLGSFVLLPGTSAHGFVSGIFVDGKHYPANDPSWHLLGKTPSAVWYSLNYGQQNPIFSKDVSSNAMACHIDATPGSEVVPVTPGETIYIKWETPEQGPWRPTHEGPVLDYLAACGGDCRNTTSEQLEFFKIAEAGMYESPYKNPGSHGSFGRWGTDTLRDNNNTWKVTIPRNLSGPHVLRTEPIALMGAGHLGHAQMYPQCINLDIQSEDPGVHPCATGDADCRLGSQLYSERDPGLFISIHGAIKRYQIPGPAVWKAVDVAEKPVVNQATVSEQHWSTRYLPPLCTFVLLLA